MAVPLVTFQEQLSPHYKNNIKSCINNYSGEKFVKVINNYHSIIKTKNGINDINAFYAVISEVVTDSE